MQYSSENYFKSTFLLVLERAHFISSLSFVEFQTVEFEHVSSSCLSNSSFGLSDTSFSGFIELQFNRVWVLKVKTGRVFKFPVACSSTNLYQIAFQDPKARWVGNTESTHVRVNLPSQDGSISMLTIIWVFSYSTTTYWSIFSRSSSTLSQIFRTFSILSEPLIKK